MIDYRLVPVDPTPEMVEAAEDAYMPFGDMELAIRMAILVAPDHFAGVNNMVEGEPVAWLIDWPEEPELGHYFSDDPSEHARSHPLYLAPQPAEQHPVAWIRIRGDRVIVSRCDWMYPASTEGAAGPRDEQRFMAVGRRDGDIVLPAPEGALDREDLKTMLTWPNTSKPAQPPAPDVARLVGKVRMLIAAGNRLNASSEECIYGDGMVEVAGSEYWCEFRDALEAATEALAAWRQSIDNQ